MENIKLEIKNNYYHYTEKDSSSDVNSVLITFTGENKIFKVNICTECRVVAQMFLVQISICMDVLFFYEEIKPENSQYVATRGKKNDRSKLHCNERLTALVVNFIIGIKISECVF